MACSCITSGDRVDQVRKSKAIDKLLREEKTKLASQVKILVLGAGESGKSTILKQMKIIHGKGFEEEERLEYRSIIYENVIGAAKALVSARQKLQIPWGNAVNEAHGNLIETVAIPETPAEFLLLSQAVKELWEDEGIQNTYGRRNEFLIGDSTAYFMNRIDEISYKDYTPSAQDILCSRIATRGIVEYDFVVKKVPFKFVDVGGQRSQRVKWFHCFNQVTSILFLAATNGFDSMLAEHRLTNRLEESVNIFETVVTHASFKNVSVVLFLNKVDMLKEKVKRQSIKDYFPSFPDGWDPHNITNVQDFIVQLYGSKANRLYHHFTTATDTENVRRIFDDVRCTILENNLNNLQLF